MISNMKKKILFRGKRTDNGEWVEGYYFKTVWGSFIMLLSGTKSETEVIPDTVGQFTGLTDKNGVKVFEGDIIESDGRIYKLRDFDDLIELYYWHRECVILEEYTTIIGNIHDI